MPLDVIQHPDATAELIEAARFYDGKVPTLGAQFLDAVEAAVATVARAPKRWQVVEEDVRRYLVPRFPYAIYYRVLPDQIRILAFKHHSRHPDYWRHRAAPRGKDSGGSDPISPPRGDPRYVSNRGS